MRCTRVKCLVFWVIVLISQGIYCSAQADREGLTSHVWGIADGLPDQEIQAVVQTADNYLWLGTPHGLVRFDGFRFVDYGGNLSSLLHEFGVSSLLAAKDGSLWVGSFGGGITHLSLGKARVYGSESGLGTLSIRVVYQDTGGAIWAGTDHGIYRYANDHFVRVLHLGDPSVLAITADARSGLWFAGHRLIHYDGKTYTDVPLPPQKSGIRIRSLVLDASGILWIGTPYGMLQRLPHGAVRELQDLPWNIRALHLDSQHRLWIGTVGEGLIIRDGSEHSFKKSDDDPQSSRIVLAFASDAGGDLWVGTQSGLKRFSNTGVALQRIRAASASEFASVFIDNDQSIFLSCGRLIRVANGNSHVMQFPAIGRLRVRAFFRDRTGAVWLGTMGHGAYRFIRGMRVQNYSSELGTGFVTGFLDSPDGAVWISTDSGVAKWDHGKVTSYQTAIGAPHDAVLSMANAPDGGLWVGTSRGLFLLRDGEYRSNTTSAALGKRLIWSLLTTSDHLLWIGAESGLYASVEGRLRHLLLPHGSSASSAAISVIQDARGRVLVAEPTLVYRAKRDEIVRAAKQADLSTQSIPNFRLDNPPEIFALAKETGAQMFAGLPATGVPDHAGGAWFATDLGLVHILPSSISQKVPLPPVMIEKILIDGKLKENDQGPLVLGPSVRNLEIQASPILLSARTDLRLRRRLGGFDRGWVDLEPNASSIYSKLPPGEYKFQVEGSWPGENGASYADLEIVQQSAFYRHPWFIATCLLAISLIAWLYYQFQIRQVALRFQAVAEERSRVAREMHDTLLQGCIGVSSLLEAVASSQEQQVLKKEIFDAEPWFPVLQYAREQIAQTIHDARGAIWDLRNPEQQNTLEDALAEQIKLLRPKSTAQVLFEHTGLSRRLQPRIQHEIVMASREALLNAISHARARHITMRVGISPGKLTITIVDDGVGFDAAARNGLGLHFGLSSIDERMNKAGGVWKIESSADSGTSVELFLHLTSAMVCS